MVKLTIVDRFPEESIVPEQILLGAKREIFAQGVPDPNKETAVVQLEPVNIAQERGELIVGEASAGIGVVRITSIVVEFPMYCVHAVS